MLRLSDAGRDHEASSEGDYSTEDRDAVEPRACAAIRTWISAIEPSIYALSVTARPDAAFDPRAWGEGPGW